MDDPILSFNNSPPPPPLRRDFTSSPNIIPPPPPLQRVAQANSPERSNDTNLAKINNAFQDETIIHIPINFYKSPSLIILCDFPSRIPDFGIRSQVFALDDLSYFLNATLNDSTAEIIVTTQQFSILRNLLFYKRIFIYSKLRKSYVTNINLYLYHIYIYRFIPKQNE